MPPPSMGHADPPPAHVATPTRLVTRYSLDWSTPSGCCSAAGALCVHERPCHIHPLQGATRCDVCTAPPPHPESSTHTRLYASGCCSCSCCVHCKEYDIPRKCAYCGCCCCAALRTQLSTCRHPWPNDGAHVPPVNPCSPPLTTQHAELWLLLLLAQQGPAAVPHSTAHMAVNLLTPGPVQVHMPPPLQSTPQDPTC